MEKSQPFLSDCKTLDELYDAIQKTLISPECDPLIKDGIREQHYNSARLCAINFRKICPNLPSVPDHDNNASAGLQNLMQWCVEAKEAIRKLVINMDKQPISNAISLLEKLKTLPDNEFPHIDEGIWKNAMQRAKRIAERYAKKQKLHNWRSGYSIQAYESRFAFAAKIISELREVAAERKEQNSNITQGMGVGIYQRNDDLLRELKKAHTEVRFFRAVEKVYRIMSENYNNDLNKLEQSITDMIKQINILLSTIKYPLDAYDTLMGIGLQEHLNDTGRSYDPQTLVDWAILGPAASTLLYHKPRKELVDSVIALLIRIRDIEKRPNGTQDIKDFLQDNLRKAIRNEPKDEQEVQDAIETLLIGRGLKKGVDYDREVGRIKISIKEAVPDFIFPKQEIALEVKLSKTKSKSKVIVDEINADIKAYSKKYSSLVFLVYDLGTIRNVHEFKQGLESETVSILVVKH